ncbi:MAG: carboxypeptidase-like regulatory domain-containing protein [Bacteroidia bacterium]|nr:carboxypeptidase-like regulatory domain-containing protein [Bacteroidia bacterium]
MHLKQLLLVTTLILAISTGVAQKLVITGMVTDTLTRAAVKGATVTYYDPTRKSVLTGADGSYKITTTLGPGDLIRMSVNAPNYVPEENEFTLAKPGANRNVFHFKILKIIDQKITMHGYVRDTFTKTPVPGADVSYINSAGQKIQSTQTDSEGYYEFKIGFEKGAIIKVRVNAPLYIPKESEHTIINPNIDANRLDFDIMKIEDQYIKATITVIDGKSKKRKPIPGVQLKYDYWNRTWDTLSGPNGDVMITIPRELGGEPFEIRVQKPGYRENKISPILRTDKPNTFDIPLYRLPRFPWSASLITLGSATIATGGIMQLQASQNYNKYLDFNNAERESDLSSANRLRGGAVIAYGTGVIAIAGGLIYRFYQQKEEANRYSGSFFPVASTTTQRQFQAGFVYHFSSKR